MRKALNIYVKREEEAVHWMLKVWPNRVIQLQNNFPHLGSHPKCELSQSFNTVTNSF